MKTFVTTTVVAFLAIAIAFINVSQSNAQRCSERPPLSTTEVKCDERTRRPGQALRLVACVMRCRSCYERRELQRLPGCLVEEKCQCLGKENGNSTTTETTTSDGRIPSDITDSSDAAESSDTESDQELTSPEAEVSNSDDDSNDEETTTAEESDSSSDGAETETTTAEESDSSSDGAETEITTASE